MKTASNSISAKWRIAKIEDVSDLIMGQAPKGDTYNDKGIGLPLIAGASDLGYLYPAPKRHTDAPAKRCRCGDIILCVRATIGDLNWSDREYCLGRGVAALSAKPSVDSTFLYYWIQANKSALLDLGRGATFKQISKVDISTFPIPVPPIEEQRRIVGRIKELMERVDEIRSLGEEALKEAEAAKLSICNEFIRSDWPLVELCEAITDTGNGHSVKPTGGPSNGRILSLAAVKGPVLDLNATKDIYTSDAHYTRYGIRKNEVFVSRANTIDLVGLSSIANSDGDRLMYPDLLIKVTPDSNVLLPEFLTLALRSTRMRDQIKRRAKGTSQSMVKISAKDLKSLLLPLPSLKDQRLYVYTVSNALALASQSADLLRDQSLHMLPQSILRKAFAGEL